MTPPQDRPVRVVRPHSASATAGLLLGIGGLVAVFCLMLTFGALFPAMPAIAGVAFSHQGEQETRDGSRSGRGAAIAGLMIGYGALLFAAGAVVLGRAELLA